MDYREEVPRHPQYRFGFQGRTPPVIKTLLIINVVVFVLQRFVDEGWANHNFGLYLPNVTRGFIWQFLTYAFMHGDTMHILFNMFILWMFGREVEPVLGRRRFLAFYLTAAVCAGVLYILFEFAQLQFVEGRYSVPCVGASGAVMAVIMAYALYWPNRRVLFMFIFPMRIRTLVALVVVMQFVGILDVRSNVAHFAHLGGLLWGLLFVRYAPAVERVMARSGRLKSATRQDAISAADENRLNKILDKINHRGMASLSWGEKRFLKRMSRKR